MVQAAEGPAKVSIPKIINQPRMNVLPSIRDKFCCVSCQLKLEGSLKYDCTEIWAHELPCTRTLDCNVANAREPKQLESFKSSQKDEA